MRGPCDRMRSRNAWKGHYPTVEDISSLLSKFPTTKMMAISRAGTYTLNELAIWAKFSQDEPLNQWPLSGDYDTNPTNYDQGQRKPFHEMTPYPLVLYQGMQVYFTRNVDKEQDFVNGQLGVVEAFDSASKGVRVLTSTFSSPTR